MTVIYPLLSRTFMSTEFKWSGDLETGHPAETASHGTVQGHSSSQQAKGSLCNELYQLGDIFGCQVFDLNGNIICRKFGELRIDPELQSKFAEIAAVIWGGLKRVENAGGPIEYASAVYQKFKIIGIPFQELGIAVLITVPVRLDTDSIKDRVIGFVNYWAQTDGKTGPKR